MSETKTVWHPLKTVPYDPEIHGFYDDPPDNVWEGDLPTEDGFYLVTTPMRPSGPLEVAISEFRVDEGGFYIGEVVAWAELPEPFEPAEDFVWHPVGNRMATPQERAARIHARLEAPGIVPTGKQPVKGGVYLVTTTNGDVDVDEYGILCDIDDWFWYDCGSVIAWMRFPLFSPDDRSNPFWHLCEECCPTENRDFLVYDIDGKYAVLPFDVQKKAFMAAPCAPLETSVAFAELPEPYKPD